MNETQFNAIKENKHSIFNGIGTIGLIRKMKCVLGNIDVILLEMRWHVHISFICFLLYSTKAVDEQLNGDV